ncbi:hypothetical protein [Microbulbifer sp. VAAF005]|uniref:hypothetical protein n=1 Tax=Microbulbifer sp. VAAF005 TaxID=3034230 RepID=UPI0024ADED72|nr:hypothetical protein [Microbulbifer sp. VAAF005]WHI46400.1 hypothetical protein P0078_22265 [Microbulbifer sp. VAAF005]
MEKELVKNTGIDKMKTWEFIWKTHSRECTRRKIFKEIILSSGKGYITLLTIFSVLFLLSLSGYILTLLEITNFYFGLPNAGGFYIFLTLSFEFLAIIVLQVLKENYINKTQSILNSPQERPENFDEGILRYLKFSSKLREENISREDIENIMDTLEAREKLADSSGVYGKVLAKYFAALILALLATIAKTATIEQAAVAISYLGILGYLCYQIASIVPAPPERVKELRYFLTMYQTELATNATPLPAPKKVPSPKNEEQIV